MIIETIEEYLDKQNSREDTLGFTTDDLVAEMEKNPELVKRIAEWYDEQADDLDSLYSLIYFNEEAKGFLREVGCKRVLIGDFVDGDEKVLEKIPDIEDFIDICLGDTGGTAYMAIEKIQEMANRSLFEQNYQRAYELYETSYKCILSCGSDECSYRFPSYVFRNMASILMQRYASEKSNELLYQAFDLSVARLFRFYTEVCMDFNHSGEVIPGGEMLLGNRDIVWNVEYIINLLFPNSVDDVRYELLLIWYLDSLIEKWNDDAARDLLDCYNNHSAITDWYSYFAKLYHGKNLTYFYLTRSPDQDYELVRKCIQTKAENGMSSYQCLLGDLYRKGLAGMTKDEENAHYWYNKVISENKNEECVEYAKMTLARKREWKYNLATSHLVEMK